MIDEWSNTDTLKDDIIKGTKEVLCETGKATTDLIRKVIRDGMETERINRTEEIYKYNEYIIIDASWGQFVEDERDTTKTSFRGLNSSSGFQKVLRNNKKIIAIIHDAHHWSFTVINTQEGKLQMYDPQPDAMHGKANILG